MNSDRSTLAVHQQHTTRAAAECLSTRSNGRSENTFGKSDPRSEQLKVY